MRNKNIIDKFQSISKEEKESISQMLDEYIMLAINSYRDDEDQNRLTFLADQLNKQGIRDLLDPKPREEIPPRSEWPEYDEDE